MSHGSLFIEGSQRVWNGRLKHLSWKAGAHISGEDEDWSASEETKVSLSFSFPFYSVQQISLPRVGLLFSVHPSSYQELRQTNLVGCFFLKLIKSANYHGWRKMMLIGLLGSGFHKLSIFKTYSICEG